MGNCCSGKGDEDKQINMDREANLDFKDENKLITLIKIQAAV